MSFLKSRTPPHPATGRAGSRSSRKYADDELVNGDASWERLWWPLAKMRLLQIAYQLIRLSSRAGPHGCDQCATCGFTTFSSPTTTSVILSGKRYSLAIRRTSSGV